MKKGILRRPAALLKKRLWHGCFPVNFAKFLRTPFSQNTSEWLLMLQQSWRPATLLKRDFNTGVFLWIFQKFWNSFLYRTTAVAAFELCFSIRKNFQQWKWRDLISLYKCTNTSFYKQVNYRESICLSCKICWICFITKYFKQEVDGDLRIWVDKRSSVASIIGDIKIY